jgi:cytochrome c oxidase accessory protein FixG
MKLDKGGMSADKLRKKALKHTLWILFSFWTGVTFVGYFTPIRELTFSLLSFSLGPWELFWIAFFCLATYANAGWMREQVCIYMCPYARFQGAMFDKDTLVISYDTARGDPKGSRQKSEDPKEKGLGDCINCQLCVQVCPTGIDIRDGLQYECIGCAACIDVCNGVMDKMDYNRDLIRYTTEHQLEGHVTNFLRPKLFIYMLVLIAIITAMGLSMANRSAVELDVIRDRNGLYRETSNGLIENTYTLKVMNKDTQVHSFDVTASGLPNMKLLTSNQALPAEPGEVLDLVVSLQIRPVDLERASNKIELTVTSQQDSDISISEEARFLGP